MHPLNPQSRLPTHQVTNVPPHQGDQDHWANDTVLRETVAGEGAGWAEDHFAQFGKVRGAAEQFDEGTEDNRQPPERIAGA